MDRYGSQTNCLPRLQEPSLPKMMHAGDTAVAQASDSQDPRSHGQPTFVDSQWLPGPRDFVLVLGHAAWAMSLSRHQLLLR